MPRIRQPGKIPRGRGGKYLHTIVRMMRMISEIVCPGVVLLGEVVMEPEKVDKHIGVEHQIQPHRPLHLLFILFKPCLLYAAQPECHMLYNVTTMATTWHTVAVQNVGLLRKQLDIVNSLPKEYVFLNYLRCHDDIGWGLDYRSISSSFCSNPAFSMPHMEAVVPQNRASPVTGSALEIPGYSTR